MKSPRLAKFSKESDSNVRLKPGDITWVKLRAFSWWPAQVVDEKSVSESCRPQKRNKRAVLLRLYGSYEYVYRVDLMKSMSEFKSILEQENCSCQDMIQKAINKVMPNSSSNTSENTSKSREDSNKGSKRRAKQDDAQTNNKRDIPASNFKADLEKSPEMSARRFKVMQSLGLMAPSGSPFYKGGHIQAAA